MGFLRMMDRRAFDAHLEELFACRLCKTVEGKPVSGAVFDARVMLVGQAPGPRERDSGRPFAYTAGKRLFAWFETLGVGEEEFRERVYIGAAIRCFPGRAKGGGDRAPSSDEIARCSVHLDREIALLRPGLVITVGGIASKLFIGSSVLGEIVGPLHRARRAEVDLDVVALPHPSGRSTWLNVSENRQRLERALGEIRRHEAFRILMSP